MEKSVSTRMKMLQGQQAEDATIGPKFHNRELVFETPDKRKMNPGASSFVLRTIASASPNLGLPQRTPLQMRDGNENIVAKTSTKKTKKWQQRVRFASPFLKRQAALNMKKNKNKSKSKKPVAGSAGKENSRPEWDSSIHNLDQYKLSKEELRKQHMIHVSRHDKLAKTRLQKEGISWEEEERVLSSVLSPTWLIKPKQEQQPEEEDGLLLESPSNNQEEQEPEDEDSDDNHDGEDDDLENQQLNCMYEELFNQVKRYESVTGRDEQANEESINALEIVGEASMAREREMKLMKLCSRLIGHLAGCEKDLANRTALLEQTVSRCNDLNLRFEACKVENQELENRCRELEKENFSLRLTNHHKQQQQANSSENEEKQVEARISRRHQLMAKWRQENK